MKGYEIRLIMLNLPNYIINVIRIDKLIMEC